MGGKIVGIVGGAISFAITVFAWFGITPDMVGDAMYGTIRTMLPFVAATSGFVIGWSARSISWSCSYARMIEGFSRDKARAALDAYEAGGLIDAERSKMEIIGSINAGQDVFVIEAFTMYGRTVEGDRYGITDGFRAFLGKGRNLEKLKRRAR